MQAGAKLRRALKEKGVTRIMSAHSALSALLVEEAGFDGVWASGFELSALYGLADVSLVTMTQHLDMVRAMVARTSIPIVADIDTGFGNAVNVVHATREYEKAGVGGIVMEDKTFPKRTSLIGHGPQKLVSLEEFQGKLEAACAARRDRDLVVIARTEALIAGFGQDEALRRAAAYEEAGADLIFVHSKAASSDEVEAFARAWRGAIPIVLTPTAYPHFSAERMAAFGNIAMVIYGNYAIRACVAAMRETFRAIIADGDAVRASGKIATVSDIFDCQRMDEIKELETRFLR